VPRTTTADSWVRRSHASHSSGVQSFTPATHCITPVPSRSTRNCTLPLERWCVSQPRSSTALPASGERVRDRIQGRAEGGFVMLIGWFSGRGGLRPGSACGITRSVVGPARERRLKPRVARDDNEH
jgi:hypothetical protein